MQKTLPKIKFGKKELTPILTDDGKTVTISWPKGTETTEEQRKIIYEAGFKYDGKAKAIKAPYNAEVKTVLEKLSGAKIDVEPKTEVQTLREIFASNGIDASKPVELPKTSKVSLADMLDKLKNADDVNADDETDTSATDVGKPLCTIRLNGVKGEVRSLPDGRVSLKMEKRVKFTKEEKQAYKKAGFAWKSKEEGSIAENTPALDEFLKKYLVQDASDNNANGNTATLTKGEKPKQSGNTNKNEVGKADKLPTIQVGGKELNPILRQKDNMVWIAPSGKLPLDTKKSLSQAGFRWDSGGFYYAPYGQQKVKDFLEKHQKDNIGGSKETPGLDATVTGVENFFKSNGIDTGKTVELPTVPKVSLADLLNKVKNANADNENKGEKSDKKEGSGVDKAEGKSEPIKKELSVDKKTDSDEGEQPIQQQADVETKPDVSTIVKGLNTDDNGLYLMNKKTPADNIELIQKYNEATLLELVEGICDKWRNGEISIDEASKAVNALKRVYVRSERQVPTVSKDCIEKIEETRKQMFIDREADAKEQHRKQLEADKRAREEAEAPRKEFYQKALKDAKDAAENVVKQHKEGKMFLEEALDSLEKIKSELEKKLETSKDSSGKGDFLRVDDRKAVYDKQVAAVKKEQEKIDKKILESATTDAMADGNETLSKEGQEVYDWVKSSLSNDSKKRFSANAIEAAAQLLAFRAQTWAGLFNKYLGTNYTPLAFAQRYKFAFFDDKIDNRSSSTAGLTTQILTADEAAKGRLAFSEKASTTTLFHEMAHMFFADLALVAESPLAPQKLKDDFKQLREWIDNGADKTSKGHTQTPYFSSEQRSKSDGGPVDEERFAQAVVKHIADADTPIPWLNKLFADLKAEIQSYIEKFMLKIQKALGKESEKSKKWANAYTFDFEIPADVKRIINEVVFSGKDETSKPFAERVKELDDLRSQIDAMLNGDSHVGAAEARDFQMKLANASKGGNEYTDEQNASLTAARNSIWLEFDEKRAKHDARVALAEVKNGNTDTNIVAKAASGLIEGKPDELETLPKEALNILDSVLSEQGKEDVADIGKDSIAAAVTADYAFDGKLSDDFDALIKGLKDDELGDETIDAVKKYADAMLRALQKYQDLYDKHEAAKEAVKTAKEASDAVAVEDKASHVTDAPMLEDADEPNKRKDEGNLSVRESELGEKILRSRDEILEKCKKLFNTDDVQTNDNGTFTITTKGGNKFTLDIQNNLLVNEAEAERARKEHGIADDADMTIEGYYRPMYSSDVEGIVSVSLDSRENTEAHEATHAAIDLALGEKEKDILFVRAEKIAKEYSVEKEAEEIAADAVRNFVSAREHGYITDFTKSETEKLQKTPWGRMMLRANRVGRKAALFTKLHETELQKTAWGRMILAKNRLQRLVAKLMRKFYDFVKKAQAMFEEVDNFHDLARRIELGEVWGEKASERSSDGDKHQAKKSKLDEELQKKIDEDSDRFSNIVDEWAKKPKEWFKNHEGHTIDFMSQTPLVLTITGAKQLPLKITAGFLGHSTKSKHPGMTAKVLKQIPKAIVEPLMILKDFENVNGIRTEFPNKRVLVLGVKNEYGATVIVPIKIDADGERGYGKVNLVQNAFGVGETKPKYQYFVDALKNNEVLYIDDKKSLAWAKTTNGARTDTLVGLIRKRASDNSVLHKQNLVNARQANPGKYSVRSKPSSQDSGITGINEAYKNKLEEAYAAGAGDNRITAIMNEHQKELAEYLKDKGEKQKERTKLRAAEIRSLRKKLHAKEIESFSLAGAVVRLDKDGKEVVEKIDDGLPNRTYVNKRHEGEKPANAAQKLGSRIAREEPKTRTQKVKEWILNAKSQFYKHFVDKYDALHLLDDAIAKASGKKIDGANTILGRMNMAANSASGMAMALLEGNADELKQAANKYGIKNMVSLQMLMEKIGTDMKAGKFADYVKSTNPQGKAELEEHISAIENYLVARSLLESAQNHRLDCDRSVAEWEKKGSHGDKPVFEPYKFPGGMTEQEIRQVIKEAPVGFKEYAKMFKGITDNMLDILYNTGLITGDRYLATKSRYKAYCPLMRDFSDTAAVDSFIDQINSGKGLANVSDPLKNRSSEGSERDIVPPLRTIVTSINALTQKAERNRVGQYAVKQANKYKLDDYIKEVKGNSGDAKNCIFTVLFNGEKHSYQTIPEMYPAITAAVEPLVKIEMALLTKPAQWLRTGSTMSPSFILRNLIRDTLFAGIASKNGFIPIYDSIRGMNALLNNQQLRSEFNASGVISSNFYGDGESVMRSLESMAGGKKWQELGLLDIIKGIFHKPIEGLEWISNLAEAGTRMGEFMRAREKGKSVDQAAYDAVEITLNFGRSGATGQQINRMVPFFNACIQGGDKLYRMYKADPRRTLLRIGVYIVLPSIALWLWNHDEDWYKELDPNIKMTNWILPNGIRIPKPQEAGILFGSGAEAMLDAANGQDPKAMANWRSQVLDTLAPGIIPTLALPLLEWLSNYSFFRGKPIVSKSQERLPDELQYGPYTSEMSKALGDNPIMKLSPVKIDNLWRGYTGTMGMFLWQAPDLLIAEKRNLPEKKLSEMAFVRDFVVNDMNLTRTMNDFYQLKEASAKWQAGYGKKGKPTVAVSGVNTAANTISKLQKEIRDITTNPKYTPAQKRMLVDKNRAKQQKVAQLCLKKYGDKFDI